MPFLRRGALLRSAVKVCTNNHFKEDYMNPQVTLWREPPRMDTGAPLPALFSNSKGDLYIAYYVSRLEDASLGKVALLRFSVVLHFRFGHPNEDVLHAHPLYENGLKHYEFHIVEHSPLIAELEERNSVHPRHVPGMYKSRFKHFVVTFHDETLEVVAKEGVVAGRSSLPPNKSVITIAEQR